MLAVLLGLEFRNSFFRLSVRRDAVPLDPFREVRGPLQVRPVQLRLAPRQALFVPATSGPRRFRGLAAVHPEQGP